MTPEPLSDRYLAAIIASSEDAIVTKTGEGIIASWNPAAERIFGYPAAEVVGRSITLLFPADRLHEEAEFLRRLGRGEPVQHFETQRIRKDGTVIDVSVTLSPVLDDEGRLAGISKVARDISAAKRAEAQLAAHERLMRVTLASIGDAVIATDEAGIVTFINPVAELLTGWRMVEALGTPLSRVFLIVNERTDREAENPVTRALREGAIVGLANHTVLIARDGARHAIDDSAAPIHDAEGRVFGAVMVFRDVSERRRAEDSHQRLAAIIQSSEDAIVSKTLDGIITSWNPGAERMFGYPADEVIGRSVTILFPPNRLSEEAEFLHRLGRGERIDHFETVRIRKDGRHIDVSVTLSPLRNEHGEIVGVAKVARDITERVSLALRERAALREAEEANRLKDEFLATLSHELRTPLNAVYGWIRMIRSEVLDAEGVQKGLDAIERNCRVQVEMITDLLDVSRIRRGQASVNLTVIDLGDVARSAIETVRPTAAAKGVVFHSTVERALVRGDPARLQQVLWNLLSNAVKFTPTGGRVDLVLSRRDSAAQIDVRDTGVGIAPDVLPTIFEPFRQGDGSITRRYGGLGLGLAIVRQLVELHGGTVHATSTGTGEGAVFTVTLPMATEDAPATGVGTATALSAPGRVPRLDGTSVLVVDDETDACELTRKILESVGCRVSTATSTAEALVEIERQLPHVVLADLGLPGQDGFALLSAIRARPGPRIPVAAVTAYVAEEDRERALRAGFDVYVSKPVDPSELVRTVRGLRDQPAS